MKILTLMIILCWLVSGCGGQTQSTLQPTQAQETTEAQSVETLEAQPTDEATTGEAIISWHQEGGIVGFCDTLVIYSDGTLSLTTCKTEQKSGSLTPEQLQQVNDWMTQYQSFELQHQDRAVADAMTTSLNFNGTGTEVASEEVQQQIQAFAQVLLMAVRSGQSN